VPAQTKAEEIRARVILAVRCLHTGHPKSRSCSLGLFRLGTDVEELDFLACTLKLQHSRSALFFKLINKFSGNFKFKDDPIGVRCM
jgi:5-carboxymethyl-2-hydroxymuconate isomerase